MSNDGKNDEIDGTVFALPNEPTDVIGGEAIQPKESGSRLFYWTIIIVIIGVSVALIIGFFPTEIFDENDAISQEKINTEIEANNVTIEPTRDEVMRKLQTCTIHYIKIQGLIDQMERDDGGFRLGSLPEEKQEQYNENYKVYFDLYCNKVQNEIEQTNTFKDFNRTRNE